MGTEYSADEIIERVPDLVQGVSQLQTRDKDALVALLADVGLSPYDRFEGRVRERRPETLSHIDFALQSGAEDGLERRVRAAITRRVGKPAGTAKHWDAGRFEVGITCRRVVGVTLIPVFSIEEIRAAAQLWLADREFEEWLVATGLDTRDGIASGPRVGTSARTGEPPARATIHTPPDRPASVSLTVQAMRRVPGSRPTSDDESYADMVQFLTDELGAPTHPSHLADRTERWVIGAREFAIRRMRSGSRTVEFTQSA